MGSALREAWLWLLLAFLLGLVVGYFLKKWTVRERTTMDNTTTTRIAELEAQLEDCKSSAVRSSASKSSSSQARVANEPAPAAVVAAAAGANAATITVSNAASPAVTEPAALVAPVAKKAPAAKAPVARKPAATAPASKAPASKAPASKAPVARKPAAKAVVPDLAAGKAALGTTVKLDDLKLIEGIGPKIEALIKADGLTTWRQLSKANVERLQGILDAAGPRYNIHNPGSWPTQAGLLADGKWVEFKTLTDNLTGGK